jgi:hypothetical protein
MLTKEQFLAEYAKNSNTTEEELLTRRIAVPCRCHYPECQGWAMVINDPDVIKGHNELYGPKS